MTETFYEQKPNKDDVEVMEGKADLWTPLNCLVKTANRTKSSKSNLQGTAKIQMQLKLSVAEETVIFGSPWLQQKTGKTHL